jgi:hypothetical protein
MATDTSTTAKGGDIATQQAYFANLFKERATIPHPDSAVHLFHPPFTSVRGRLDYLKSLPAVFEGKSLEHNFGTPEENQRQYLARKRADQENYTSQMIAVKRALEWAV